MHTSQNNCMTSPTTEAQFIDQMKEAIYEAEENGVGLTTLDPDSFRTFEEVGMMTLNAGFVVRDLDGNKFQVTVVAR